MGQHLRPASRACALLGWSVLLAAGGWGGGREASSAPPAEPVLIAVLGTGADGLLAEAQRGALLAGELPGLPVGDGRPLVVEAFDDGGTAEGLAAALKRLKARKPVGVVALPSGDLRSAHAEAARSLRVPWFMLTASTVDALRGAGNAFHLAPSFVSQAVAVGDALRAPLGAASVAVVREPTAGGAELEAALRRNLPSTARDLGSLVLEAGGAAAVVEELARLKPEWVLVALTGAHLERFARALESAPEVPRCLYLDLSRSEALRLAAPRAFERACLLGGPDPEGQGRAGEALLTLLEKRGQASSEMLVRAAEATRRLLTAARLADGSSLKKLMEALAPERPSQGLLGPLAFEPPGTVRFFPLRLWRVRNARFEELPAGQLPTPECGPPLGFARAAALPPPPRGRLGFLTYGEAPVRTIEADLNELQLSTGGYDPELDQLVKDEILARAMRIAYRLFRREADGTPISGWSWGMVFTTHKPVERSPSAVWIATLAGDDEAAGGRVTGSGSVAIYTTFLKRTMYAQHKLDPPLEAVDKPHLLGRHRWGEDVLADQRGEKIRCLIDGFASAVALTLAHEFGHLCGCGHDVEHPTSIMNVVAGAGASWADAVWIPSHQKNVSLTLGVEGVEK